MINLRWYQEKIAPLVFNYWSKNPDKHPVVAIPTGAGKSLIIADLIYQAYSKWGIEIIVLSHRKEILSQNKSALMGYLKQKGLNADVGIYSAGLNAREKRKITIAGIQSVFRKVDLFKNVKLIIIDEAHLISPNNKAQTMYHKFIDSLPNAKCIGLTATPYRLGSGYIVGEDHIFDEIIFDLTSKAQFNKLIRQGYLTKLISKRTEVELDAEGVATIGGDYSEKELALKFDKYEITNAAINEVVQKASDYKKWLIFAINIDHAEHIVAELNKHGISAIPVHSKMDFNRELVLNSFKKNKIKALVNVNILTTGIDVPDIDLIVFLRPTKSPVLYVQSAGRGLRTAPGKDHCLVLDFARVIQTLGPINDVVVKKKRKGKKGDAVTKVCPECDSIHAPSVRICDVCGYKFQFKSNISSTSSDANIISDSGRFKYKVDEIFYEPHVKRNAPRSLKVTYRCGLKTFREWICLEHTGYAKLIAHNWLMQRLSNQSDFIKPNTVEDALKIKHYFKEPIEIIVKEEGKYPEIIDYIFNEKKPLLKVSNSV